MKFWKNENLSDRYIPSKQKKKLLYIIHDRRKMRGKFFFFYKNQDIRFTVHTDKFPSFKTTHENLCNRLLRYIAPIFPPIFQPRFQRARYISSFEEKFDN